MVSPQRKPSEFVFLKTIGIGSFGQVKLSRCKLTGSIYAIKVVSKAFLVKTNSVLHIKAEKKALESLHHCFISKLHFTFQDEFNLYFVFDFYNGGELYHILKKTRKMPEKVVLFYILEIHAALSFIHEKGFIFRDLKPENIVLDSEGHIRIIDFGLAKDLNETRRTSSFCGTEAYLCCFLKSARTNK